MSKQLSGFLAIEGIEPSPEMVILYDRYCDPADRGLQTINDYAHNRRSAFCDNSGMPISIKDETWVSCQFMRDYQDRPEVVGQSVPHEWYEEPAEMSTTRRTSIEAHFAHELYQHLEVRFLRFVATHG